MAKEHPHTQQPTEAHLVDLLKDRSDAVRETYLLVHHLVVWLLKDVKYTVDDTDGQLGYAAHQYGYNGWGMLSLSAHAKWVRLNFFAGGELDDPQGLLGGTSKTMRNLKLTSPEEFAARKAEIESFIKQAAKLRATK
jgi:hypothetical protein